MKKAEQKTNNGNLFGKNIKHIAIFIIIASIIYVAIYCSFFGDGFFPAGKELEKRDWLQFLGAYLSFVGTFLVSMIAIFQSKYYNESENKRRSNERRQQIQPIFSIKIVGLNVSLAGVPDVFNPSKPETIPKHQNMEIEIKNVNSYPITNMFVFEKYIMPLLEGGESIKLYCAYYDSIDAQEHPDKVVELLDDIERDGQGRPTWLNIMYNDIDGRTMCQEFQLKTTDGVSYYFLGDTEDLS